MPNVNRIPFIVEDGKVKYDSFGLMIGGFPSNLRREFETELFEKLQNYQGKTDIRPLGTVEVVDKEYYRIEFDRPSNFEN